MSDEVVGEVLPAEVPEEKATSTEMALLPVVEELIVAADQQVEVETDDSPGLEALGTPADHVAISTYLKAFQNAVSISEGLPALTPLQKNLMASLVLRVPPTNISAEQMEKMYTQLVALRKWHKNHKILFGKVVTLKHRSSKTRSKKKH